MNTEIIEKANYWINSKREFEKEMIVLEEGMEEHKYCYSLFWCIKSELDLSWSERTSWYGIGRILISKDGNMAEFEGSAPTVDWIHHFENKLQSLENYWNLEISYSKVNISKLKSILNHSTPELLKMVNNDGKIILSEFKAWNDNYTELEEIAEDLKDIGIHCKLEVKTRKKAASNV
ncbi:hypothetical protein [Tenacibaculum caenipelagi]|uniref:Uncharacterized protein n=1 Tax=Tenacibaculum caenipelagi TaxID=1325435 RepID=A0A4R6TDD4_9FLAO|nr:hypothetical protein [Tenacibaculum caenipelagi]TDQ25729.1 hypothetical protein DFQ07_2159 [Tenacibaculum caenipelagi]